MNKLIWQLYNDNIISMETATILLDQHFKQTHEKNEGIVRTNGITRCY